MGSEEVGKMTSFLEAVGLCFLVLFLAVVVPGFIAFYLFLWLLSQY